MLIKDMFQRAINRPIDGVINVERNEEQAVARELEEYVITRELKKHFITLTAALPKNSWRKSSACLLRCAGASKSS